MNFLKTSFSTLSVLALLTSSAFAADALDAGKKLYADRGDVTKDANGLRNIDKAVAAFVKVEADAKTAGDKDLQYNAMVWVSKSQNFASVLENDPTKKIPFLDAAYTKAQEAKKLNTTLADANYYSALSAGRLMGIYKDQGNLPKAIKFKTEYETSLKNLNTTKSFAGDPGVSIDGYGYYRLAGRFQHETVGNILVNGDRAVAMKLLQQAYENGFVKAVDVNKVALNVVYYAEVLAKDGSPDDFEVGAATDLALAKKILEDLVVSVRADAAKPALDSSDKGDASKLDAAKVAKINPDRVYETTQDVLQAEELLAEINKL